MFDVVATRRRCEKAVGVDSESQFLAIKKFLWSRRRRLTRARQNRIFGRIATTDSETRFRSRRWILDRANERRTLACIDRDIRRRRTRTRRRPSRARGDDEVAPSNDEVVPLRDAQIPSFAFSISFTACGLALPPDDFITWPTNQPASCGLAFAWATLSGLAAMMSSTTFRSR